MRTEKEHIGNVHQDLEVYTADNQPSLENEVKANFSRRHFLAKSSLGLGTMALASLLNPVFSKTLGTTSTLPLGKPHFAPKVKRVIYLFQSGAPSQFELFDHKPLLEEMHGKDLPPSIRGEQRLTGMTANQRSFPLVRSHFRFKQFGQSGAPMSELMPHLSELVDELCFIRSMHTEAINHDPAVTFFQTGSQIPG
ncbi:MAG: DUF1501 domain-containing protein, partial [Bacteroidota bacterium]